MHDGTWTTGISTAMRLAMSDRRDAPWTSPCGRSAADRGHGRITRDAARGPASNEFDPNSSIRISRDAHGRVMHELSRAPAS